MKKLALGCGVIVIVIGVVVTIAMYVVANRTSRYLRNSNAIAALQTIGKGVDNTAPFTAPATGELTADMMRRFAAVEDEMVDKLGPRFHELEAMQNEFMRREQAEHRKATSAEDFKNITSSMGFIVQAQGAWIEALNRQRFSMDEYQWVRGRVWSASGMNLLELSSRDSSALSRGGAMRPIAPSADAVPPHNRELVKPYLPKMKNWVPLAFFGL